MKATDVGDRKNLRQVNKRFDGIFTALRSKPDSLLELPPKALFTILMYADESTRRSLKRTHSTINTAYKAVVRAERKEIAKYGSLMDRRGIMPCLAWILGKSPCNCDLDTAFNVRGVWFTCSIVRHTCVCMDEEVWNTPVLG